jgi:glucose-1-phosphate adenylyltransferase
MVCEGSIVSGATVRKSLLGYDCMVHRDAVVENTVMLSGSNVGAGCRIRGVLFDKNCSVEPGTVMGFDAEADRARFPFISAAGIIVVPKGTHIPRTGPIELAGDIATLMAQDEVAQEILLEHAADIVTSSRTRHSFDPVGPRFERYGSAPSDTGPVPTLTSERAGNEEL